MERSVPTVLKFFAIISVVSIGGANVSNGAAQVGRQEPNCKRATQIVEKGKPDRKEEWAWATVVGCGAAGGVAAGDAWLQLRAATDTSQLEALYSRLWSFRDAALFSAARSIMTDASASPQSRVYSAMLLLVQVFDSKYPEYSDFVSTNTYSVCQVGSVYDRVIVTGSSLPVDARQQLRAAAQAILSKASAPIIVQSAARCVDQEIMLDDRVQASKPIVPPWDRLRSDCRLAAQVIASGSLAPKKVWAYGFIRECPEAGEALAWAWNRSLRAGDLGDREYVSTTMLDSRVLTAVTTVAVNTRRRPEERRSPLVVLTALYAPGRSLMRYFWDHSATASLAQISDGWQQPGSSPITAGDRARALAAIRKIAATDASPQLRAVTSGLARELAHFAPRGTRQ